MLLRVLLASRNESLADDARGTVAGGDLVLTVVDEAEGMWQHLRGKPCDLLIVDQELLGADPTTVFDEVAGLPDSPEAIVLLTSNDHERRAELLDAGALACVAGDIERHTLYRTIRALVHRTKRQAVRELMIEEAGQGRHLSDFASKSPSMQRFLTLVRKVVNTNSSLLVLGETGVGKEYLARAIHAEGPRARSAFVAVSCAALPEGLLESELFGHVAGAFTGAEKARRGYFELAHKGTVFLDEIGELPAHVQVKLLRVLQERTVQPVGSEKVLEVDVRVIAATNRDLKEEMEASRFRSDLYYRIGVVALTVPPLRERREDIPDLVRSHIEHFRKRLVRPVFGIQPAALEALMTYSWPGNVRELINVIERAVLLTEGDEVGLSDLPDEVRGASGARSVVPPVDADAWSDLPLQEAREKLMESFERRYLEELLSGTCGRIGETARQAGITPRSLYDKMRRLGLRKESFRAPAGRSS